METTLGVSKEVVGGAGGRGAGGRGEAVRVLVDGGK